MPITELVRIVDADPDLAEVVDAEQRASARRHLLAEVATLGAGADLEELLAHVDTERALGLLVLEGVLTRRVEVVGHAGVELIGPGDLIRPWQLSRDLATLPASTEWRICELDDANLCDGAQSGSRNANVEQDYTYDPNDNLLAYDDFVGHKSTDYVNDAFDRPVEEKERQGSDTPKTKLYAHLG